MHTSAKTLQVYCISASCFTFVCQLLMPVLSVGLYVFISLLSSGTYCACIPQPWQRVPITSVKFNFFPFCCYTSRQKSVIEPRVVLACKTRPFQTLQQCCKEGIKTRVSAGLVDLGEMQAGHRCLRRSGTLMSAEGSRSWCSYCFSGCSNSAEARTSCQLKLPLISLLITASPRQQILPHTWCETHGTCEHLSSRSRSQTCSCTRQWFPLLHKFGRRSELLLPRRDDNTY